MPEEKKIILSVSVHDDKDKSKAMTIVSSIGGVTSIAMDTKDSKLTVIGDVDPVKVTEKLRKKGIHAQIVTVGPAKEPEKKKEEPKKEDPKKDAEAEKKKMAELLEAYKNYRLPCMPDGRHYYYVHSAEEDPNACVIC